MRSVFFPALRVIACDRGASFVGYSSLALLVAIAAITLLARADTGHGSGGQQRPAGAISSD